MNNMQLPYPLTSGKSWTVDKPTFSEASNQTWAADSGSRVVNFRINGKTDNLRALIKYMVGYSQVFPTFNPSNTGAQGPYRLSRVAPARHPDMPNLRCTKILSIKGEGNRNTTGEGAIIGP